jgi:amidase
MSSELHYLELVDLGQRIQRKEISPVEVVQAQLDRIAKLDGNLHSYVTVMAESALAEAKLAEAEIAKGLVRGPLHGIPVAVKDLCWVAGVTNTAGTTIHKDFIPSEDGTAVRKLREAGAIMLGKLKLTEAAYADHHPTITAPINPFNADHWSGTSSSGSGVATAAGLCYAALGSDTGGSIRFPSSANGLTGLKPTWGRVSRHGAFELAATLDHIGPMARSAADAGAVLGAIAGSDPRDPTASLQPVPNYLAGMRRGLRGLRVGIDARWNTTNLDDQTANVVAEAQAMVRELGAEIREIHFPDPSQVIQDWFPLCGIETAVAHEATYPSKKSMYGASLAALIELGYKQTGVDYQRILLNRLAFTGHVQALFQGVDLLLMPSQGVASPTLAKMHKWGENSDLMRAMLSYTSPFDMSGNPTLTLPGGFTEANTPIAFQLIGRHFEEETLVRAGWAFQNATDWHKRHPKM